MEFWVYYTALLVGWWKFLDGVKMLLCGSCFKVYLLTQVLPNMASIEDINAISYNLCGLVRMANGGLKAKVCIFSIRNLLLVTFSS